jgi:hypothetical protein
MSALAAARAETLEKLAAISRLIEEHRAAVYLLELERMGLQLRLRATQNEAAE